MIQKWRIVVDLLWNYEDASGDRNRPLYIARILWSNTPPYCMCTGALKRFSTQVLNEWKYMHTFWSCSQTIILILIGRDWPSTCTLVTPRSCVCVLSHPTRASIYTVVLYTKCVSIISSTQLHPQSHKHTHTIACQGLASQGWWTVNEWTLLPTHISISAS